METAKFVLDASVVLSWAFEDEESAYADWLLDGGEKHYFIVPALWKYELVHVLVKAERTGRITSKEVDLFIDDLAKFDYDLEKTTDERAFSSIKDITRTHKLGFNDAAYIELSILMDLPLATLDKAMINAARSLGIPLFLEQDHWKDYTSAELVQYLKTCYAPFP